jgi:branched-chain amino acid transport system substrate-binding protein
MMRTRRKNASTMGRILVKKRVIVFLILFMVGLFISLTGIPAFAENIRVGILLPLTGRLAELGGETAYRSFQMAADGINAAGGIHGDRLELIFGDTTGVREVGLSVLEKLITQDNVIIVAGGFSSTVTLAATDMAQDLKVPFLVSTASADRITEADREYVFRLNAPVSEQAKALGSFLRKVTSVKTVAIIHENTIFGEFRSKKFRMKCEGWGLRVILKEGYDAGVNDLTPLLSKVKPKYPDLIYMIAQTREGALLMQQAKELDLNPKMFMGIPSGVTLGEFREQAGETASFVYSPTIWDPSVPYPGAKEYHNMYSIKHEEPPDYHGAQAFASMQVIVHALKEAKSYTPIDVRDALSETSMMTILGPVKFVSYGRKTQQNRPLTYLVQWLDDGLRTVWPKKVATESYVYPIPPWDERYY